MNGPPSPTSSASALAGFSLCEAGRTVDGWGRAIFLATVLSGLPISSPPPNLFALAAGVVFAGLEAYHALRLAIDRPVFAAWARLDGDALPDALRGFDAALAKLAGKDERSGDALRPLSGRVAGVRRLLLRQAVCLGGQAAALAVILSGYFFHANA
ncbi:MAG: hypothetical protein LBK55_06895 [Azoarcus sp.]|jgi:hypothetical protein|nr:hypothetical protein [Azoarcus sp.]